MDGPFGPEGYGIANGHAFGVRVQRGQKVQRFKGWWYRPLGDEFYNSAPRNGKPYNRADARRKCTPIPLRGLLLKGSVSLDSQSPYGSLRIQFPCHPGGGSLLYSQLLNS